MDFESIKALLQNALTAICKVLLKGDRVELIPVKNGIKVIHIKRETIATEEKGKCTNDTKN